jgi:hypothetical protein
MAPAAAITSELSKKSAQRPALSLDHRQAIEIRTKFSPPNFASKPAASPQMWSPADFLSPLLYILCPLKQICFSRRIHQF